MNEVIYVLLFLPALALIWLAIVPGWTRFYGVMVLPFVKRGGLTPEKISAMCGKGFHYEGRSDLGAFYNRTGCQHCKKDVDEVWIDHAKD